MHRGKPVGSVSPTIVDGNIMAKKDITNTDLVDIQKHGINLSNPKNKDFHLQRPCKN